MEPRPAFGMITRFVLRFAALMALTLAVLASVSVNASRSASDTPVHERPRLDTAADVNGRRYPLTHPR